MTRLGEVVETIVDCEHKTAPIDPDGEYYAVGTPAMNGFAIDYGEARRISRQTFKLWTRRMTPRRGDLLLAREAPVGPVVLIPDSENVAPGQRTVLLRPQTASVNPLFLYYALKFPATQHALQERAAGSTVAHLNVADIRDFVFPFSFPDMNIQSRVIEVLGALDSKITSNHRLSELSHDLTETHYHACLRGVVDQVPLRDVASFFYGKALKADDRRGGVVPGYGSGGIVGWHDESLTGGPAVIVGRKGSVGNVYWSSRPAYPIDTTFYVRPAEDVPLEFCYFLLRSLELNGMNVDSAVPGLNREAAMDRIVRKSSVDALRAFADDVRPLFDLREGLAQQSRTLAALRDTLLPALMSGRLSVRDAEAAVSEVV